jgi:two-component system CheB/CheR fusion protein
MPKTRRLMPAASLEAPLTDAFAPDAAPATGFPIVAIGASAGGLQPLSALLDSIPAGSGMAFVVVTHLDPSRESHLPELLSRRTKMPVRHVQNGEEIRPDHVYVMQPNASLTIEKGVLHVEALPQTSRPKLIDLFMGSLARDQKARSVAIVLSGLDADGTIGLKQIKVEGGMVMVQDPRSAEYDDMPQNAVATGLADFVLPVEQMGPTLLNYARNAGLQDDEPQRSFPAGGEDINRILVALLKSGGIDFRDYKPGMIERRIKHRMALMAMSSLKEFGEHIESSAEARRSLGEDFLIGVTEFFREPNAWKALSERVLPELFTSRGERPVRTWVPGCASGEEVYSLAMILSERAPTAEARATIEMFGTDVNRRALEHARRGIYPSSISSSVSQERLKRFFVQAGDSFQVNKELRSLIVFSPHNLLVDPPFSRMDIVSCRNLLIYLQPSAQRVLASLFAFSLNEGGFLFLGRSESMPDQHQFFEPVAPQSGIFRRKRGMKPSALNFYMATSGEAQPPDRGPPPRIRASEMAQRVHKELLARFTPAAVAVDVTSHVMYFHGDVDAFLRRESGAPTDNLMEMLRQGLSPAVRSVLHQAIDEGRSAIVDTEMLAEQERVQVRVEAVPLKAAHGTDSYYLITFETLSRTAPPDIAGTGSPGFVLERELRQTRQDMEEMIHSLQLANEELKMSNEEGLSANEELQSANEELASSKEELQSLNEEMNTVNGQLEMKVRELEQLNDDLNNLLRNTRIACLFLDRDLRIRRYTPPIEQLISVRPGDMGRPITDFASPFINDDLVEIARAVLADLNSVDGETAARDGKWYWRSVQPYESTGNRVDGIVVTFTDITSLKQAEEGVRRLATVMQDSNDGITVHDLGGHILDWNRAAERMYGYTAAEARALGVASVIPESRREEYEFAVARAARGEPLASIETQRLTKDGRMLDVWLTISVLRDEHGRPYAMATTERDITERLRSEQQLRYRAMLLQEADRRRTEFLAMLAHELRNPLAPVRNALHLIRHEKASAAQIKWSTDVMDRQTQHLQRLIDDLLDVSRITSGKVRLQRETVDTRSIVRNAIEATAPLVEARANRLSIKLPDKALWIFGDAARLQQVIGNLLTNACKYSDKESEILVEAFQDRDDVVIRVVDNGIGIAPKLLPQIFELFIQGDQSIDRAQGGLGIGLTLVRQLVEMHNGQVEARSEGVGKGSEFIVRLPAVQEARERTRELPQPTSSGASVKRRILIVDDNVDFAVGMKMLLDHEGHVVQVAHDGPSAIEASKAFAPDVVLLDLGLPGMNGFETAQALRAMPEMRHVLLIAISGYAQEEDRRRSEREGFDDHLKKPVDPKQVLEVIQGK